MTVFTTSSSRQISFQIWLLTFKHENVSDRHPDCWLLVELSYSTSVSVRVCNSERPSKKEPRRRLKTIQLETDTGGRTWQQELPTERQRRKSLIFLWEWFRGCESTFWDDANIQPWCRVSLYKKSGQFLITEKGTHYHFCILSPFNSSSGFVSTKSAKTVFFVAQFSSLVNQSGITRDKRVVKLLKVHVLTPQHVGIVTAFCILYFATESHFWLLQTHKP